MMPCHAEYGNDDLRHRHSKLVSHNNVNGYEEEDYSVSHHNHYMIINDKYDDFVISYKHYYNLY